MNDKDPARGAQQAKDAVAETLKALQRAGAKTQGEVKPVASKNRYLKPRPMVTRLDGRLDMSFRDPKFIGDVLKPEIARRGWGKDLAAARLANEWDMIVGPEIGRHTFVIKYEKRRRELHVQCDSTSFASTLRLMQANILSKIANHVGPDVVEQLKILNPDVGPRRSGRLRVRGRGQRDDYG